MLTAYLLYDGFTALDVIGPHDVLSSVPGSESVFVAERPGAVASDRGAASLLASHHLAEVTSPDVVVVPGGYGTRALLANERLLTWLRRVHVETEWTTSVCTGSLLLAAAGLLEDVPATTHWLTRDTLAELGARVTSDRVVHSGKVLTAAGVSAGIDMALELVRLAHGTEVAQAVQLGIEYDPQPPLDSGSPEKAQPAITELVAAVFAAGQQAAMDAAAPGGDDVAAELPGTSTTNRRERRT